MNADQDLPRTGIGADADPGRSPTTVPPLPASSPPQALQPIIVHQYSEGGWLTRLKNWVVYTVLSASILANLVMFTAFAEYFTDDKESSERYHSGDSDSNQKIALIQVTGTIMPPFTERLLKDIDKAREDDKVKGVLLVVDSPGGLVADSHQIYHRLTQLRETKPVYVSMKSLAASGGYYVAMGAGEQGKIYAEPTTWTGSIGVIIPHYEITEMAEKLGIKALPLKTGEFKDALSPFKELTPAEKALWENILSQSFEQFVGIIDDNRKTLNREQVKALATGQIYTAKDAKANGMVDEIGFEEDAIAALKQQLGLDKVRVVKYHHQQSFMSALTGSFQANDPHAQWRALMEATVPRAMFYCSWGPYVPGTR